MQILGSTITHGDTARGIITTHRLGIHITDIIHTTTILRIIMAMIMDMDMEPLSILAAEEQMVQFLVRVGIAMFGRGGMKFKTPEGQILIYR